LIKKVHQGLGQYKRQFYYTGKRNKLNQVFMVRNVVFEPTEPKNLDWVKFAMNQIDTAFRWGKPAMISSHRVNFCGHIDPANRSNGIASLRSLLKGIVKKYPDVEFLSSTELGALIYKQI
jgi:hypothetical protein